LSDNFIIFIMMGSGLLFFLVVVAYLIVNKFTRKSEIKLIAELTEGTKEKKFSGEVIFQRLYILYVKIPGIRKYLLKIRRRLAIVNIDDEYLTRRQSAMAITKALVIVVPVSFIIFALTKTNFLLRGILLILLLFIIDSIIEGMADKIDTKLLNQQIGFFSEIRHAYREFNMIEEAIYEVSQQDDLEVSRQGEKIYEILISDDPETELEKYYDVAPNSYLKEFAGISYLTKEFGDRKDGTTGASLYLKNLNNITQELQLEILKRDKLDYVFQSLAIISAVPILFIEPVKAWAVSQFSFTKQFYQGKLGLVVQMLLIIITFVCYTLIRKIKDNGAIPVSNNYENPWQEKTYRNPFFKGIIDMFIPKQGTKEYLKIRQLLKDSASKLKMEWLYINRIVATALTFVVAIFMFFQLHQAAINYIYTNPTSDYDLVGEMSKSDAKKAMDLTEQDNYFLKKLKGKLGITQGEVRLTLKKDTKYYKDATDEILDKDAERIMNKLTIINGENFQWFELLLSMLFAIVGYYAPVFLLMFQKKMRQLEMENEVMQFQTIILMLMKIERVNVEMILEWLERYANIFKEPISTCVNNYEAGAWEALEALKEEVSFHDFIRVVEGLQSAVEKIPIKDAFDELDTERAYYQEKRKESNDRLISRKGMIGKAIGFAPMIILFVGYLIVPLVLIGLLSMSSSFAAMSQAGKL